MANGAAGAIPSGMENPPVSGPWNHFKGEKDPGLMAKEEMPLDPGYAPQPGNTRQGPPKAASRFVLPGNRPD